MSNKGNPKVNKVANLLIGGLQCGQMSIGLGRVKVTWFDTWILGQVIHNLLHKKTCVKWGYKIYQPLQIQQILIL